MVRPSIPLGIFEPDTQVRLHDHIAYFWETEAEFAAAVGFLEKGINMRDHCVVFGHDEANAQVLKHLQSRVPTANKLQAMGMLTVLGAESTGDGTLASIGDHFGRAMKAGARTIRLLGNIGWERPGWPVHDDLLRFESKVTEAAQQFPCVIICMYDVNSLRGRTVLLAGVETHPVTIRRNVVRINPLYCPHNDFVAALDKHTEKVKRSA